MKPKIPKQKLDRKEAIRVGKNANNRLQWWQLPNSSLLLKIHTLLKSKSETKKRKKISIKTIYFNFFDQINWYFKLISNNIKLKHNIVFLYYTHLIYNALKTLLNSHCNNIVGFFAIISSSTNWQHLYYMDVRIHVQIWKRRKKQIGGNKIDVNLSLAEKKEKELIDEKIFVSFFFWCFFCKVQQKMFLFWIC